MIDKSVSPRILRGMTRPAPFSSFVAPARSRPQLWRLLAGSLLIAAIFVGWLLATGAVLALLRGGEGAMRLIAQMAAPSTPTATLLLLTTFVGMAVGVAATVRWLHRRPAATLFGPWPTLVRHFAIAVGVLALIYGLSFLLWSQGFEAERGLDIGLWLRLLPLSVLLIFVQTGAEEMVFRGYLMQQIAVRIPWRIAYMGVPSVLFGALHYDPTTSGANAWLIAASAGLFGLAAADLTRVTGSLGAAWGLHFANNVLAILVVATSGTITGLALYLTPYAADDAELTPLVIVFDLGTFLAVWAILRWRLPR